LTLALADCVRQTGDFNRAIELLTPIASRSRDIELVLDYAELCLAADHLKVAEAALETADAIDPKSARTCLLKGALAEMSEPKQFEAAVSWYRKALAIHPKDMRAQNALALLLMRETPVKNWDEAGKLLEAAVKSTKPAPLAPLLNLAILRAQEGKNDEAKKL